MALLSYFSGFYYYLNSFIILALPLHTLYLLSTPQKSTPIDSLFFLPNVIYLISSIAIFYYPRISFSVLGNQFFLYWTYLFVIIKLFVFGKNEGWEPTGGTIRSKGKSYSFLMGIALTYILTYWLLFFSIINNNKFNFAIGDALLLFWIFYNMTTHLSFVTGLAISGLYKQKLIKKLNKKFKLVKKYLIIRRFNLGQIS